MFLALDELQALGPRLQYMASCSAPKTAICWRDTKRLLWDVTNRNIRQDARNEDFLELVENALLELFQPLLTNELTDGQVVALTQEIWDHFKLFAHALDRPPC